MPRIFKSYDVSYTGFKPTSNDDQAIVYKLLNGGPQFDFVELTDGNVTFVTDPSAKEPVGRLHIEVAEGDEFNTSDILRILLLAPMFFNDHDWIENRIMNRLHGGILLANNDGVITRIGETLAGYRGELGH